MTGQGNLFLSSFEVNDRVELAPHLDAWMMGDRYGYVDKVGRVYVHVRCDVSGKIRMIHPENLTQIINCRQAREDGRK